MNRYCLRAGWAFCAALLVMSELAVAQPAAGQSDGTLEDAYARECPQHQETAACKALRSAMLESVTDGPQGGSGEPTSSDSTTVPKRTPWGAYLKLVGTAWLNEATGAIREYRWLVPHVTLLEVATTRGGVATAQMTINFDGTAIIADAVQVDGSKTTFLAASPSENVIAKTADGFRQIDRISGDRRVTVTEQFKNGVWTVYGSPSTAVRIDSAQRDAQLAVLAVQREAQSAKEATQHRAQAEKNAALAAQNARWGDLGKLRGRIFTGDYDGKKSVLTITPLSHEGMEAVKIWRFGYNELAGFNVIIYDDKSNGRFRLTAQNGVNYKVSFAKDGSFGYFDHRYRLLPDGSLEITKGDWNSSGIFTPQGTVTIWQPMSTADNRRRIAILKARNAHAGDSGLVGALAMATGAALAGGNAEHVMGAAMKGAELSTDNQMTRNVLAGQGDQMIAAGTHRMYEESAQRSASSSSGAQDMGPASRAESMSPPAILGALGPSAGAGSGPPIRFYYVVSLVPTANDTRNPLCVSNVVTLAARLDADPWGRRAKAAPLVEAYRDRFVAECSRLGRITSLGNLYYTIEGVDSGWPYPGFHPSDLRVTL